VENRLALSAPWITTPFTSLHSRWSIQQTEGLEGERTTTARMVSYSLVFDHRLGRLWRLEASATTRAIRIESDEGISSGRETLFTTGLALAPRRDVTRAL